MSLVVDDEIENWWKFSVYTCVDRVVHRCFCNRQVLTAAKESGGMLGSLWAFVLMFTREAMSCSYFHHTLGRYSIQSCSIDTAE